MSQPETSFILEPESEPSSKKTANSVSLHKEKDQDGTSFVPVPESLNELLLISDFYSFSLQSLAFIQNKIAPSELLIGKLIQFSYGSVKFKRFYTHSSDLNNILQELSNANSDIDHPEVWIIKLSNLSEDVNSFCIDLLDIKKRQIGVWLIGNISELNPKIVSFLDILFAFDMSFAEYDLLRSCIEITEDNIGLLRESYFGRNRMLVFVNPLRIPASLTHIDNLMILTLYQEDVVMDITPYIPIIVVATQFLFSEASNWIDDIREKANSGDDSDTLGEELPFSENEFNLVQKDYSTVARMVRQTVTKAELDEIQILLSQIKTDRAVFSQLELQESTAAGAEAAKLRVNIQQRSETILTKVNRLDALLAKVYESRSADGQE